MEGLIFGILRYYPELNSVKHAVSFHPDSCGQRLRFTSVAELRFMEHVTLKHLVY